MRGSASDLVDGDIVADVARRYGMGAGGLKGLLNGIETPMDLEEAEDKRLDAHQRSAVHDALERQGARNADDLHEDVVGETVEWSDRIWKVTAVHAQHCEDVLDDVQPIEIESTRTMGHEETVGLCDVKTVGPAVLEGELSTIAAREIIDVLEHGIDAVEADQDDEASAARRLRKTIRDQYRQNVTGETPLATMPPTSHTDG